MWWVTAQFLYSIISDLALEWLREDKAESMWTQALRKAFYINNSTNTQLLKDYLH